MSDRLVSPIPKSAPASKSARKRLFDREYEAVKPVVAERSRGWCEYPGCTRWASVFHHRKGRVGADVNLPKHVAHLCNDHHVHVHSHVKESYENGMLVKRT